MKYPSWSRKPSLRKRHVVLTPKGWVVQETGELLVSNVQLPKSIQAYFKLATTPTIDNDTVNLVYDGAVIELDFADLRGFIDDPEAFIPTLPDPTTLNFTSAQFSPGFTGSINTTKNATRIYARGELTLWSGFITGTEAKLTTPSDFGDNPGSVQVAVDGGAFISAPNVASVYTLFTGLPHAKHFVEVRYVLPMGEAPYVAATGNVLVATGQPPALQTLSNKIQAGANSATGLYNGAVVPNSSGYSPPLQAQKGQNYGSNVGSVKIRGAFTKLVVTLGGSRLIAVSKNGAAPVYYDAVDENNNPPRAIVVPCDGSTSTYYVWDDGNGHSNGGLFAVAGDSTFLDIGIRRRLDQYGDSITFGSGPGATSRCTETMRVAAAMGFVGSTNGISGLTISGMKTLLDNVLPLKGITSDDVGILAIGGNSAADDIDLTEQADYDLCLDKMLATPYGKIICRGILPKASAQSIINAANAVLKSIMEAKNDPRLVWVDPITWTGYETIDDTHPTDNGYVFIGTKALPAYISVLGL